MKVKFKYLIAALLLLFTLSTMIACDSGADTDGTQKLEELEKEYQDKLEALKAEYEDMIAALTADHSNKIAELNNQIADTEATKAALQVSYADKVAELEAERAANEQALSELRAEYQTQIAALEADKTANAATIAALTKSYNDKMAELEAANAAHETELAELKVEYESQISTLEQEKTANQELLTKLQADYNEKVAELETATKNYNEALSAQKTQYESQISALEAEKSSYISTVNTLTQAYNDKKAELEAEKNSKSEALAAQKAEYEAQIAELQNTNESNLKEIEELEKALSDKTAELEAEKKANAEAIEQYNSQISRLETELYFKEVDIDSKKEQITNLVTALDNQRIQINTLTQSYNAKVAELEAANENHAEELAELRENYEKQISMLNLEISFKAEEINHHKEQITIMQTYISDCEIQINTLNKKVEELESENAVNSEAIANLTAQYEAQIAVLEGECISNQETIGQLWNDCRDKDNEIATLKTAHAEALATMKADYEAQIETLNSSIAAVNGSLEAIQKEYDDLDAEYKKYKTRMENKIDYYKEQATYTATIIADKDIEIRRLTEAYNQMVAEYEAEIATIEARFAQERESYEDTILRAATIIQQHKATIENLTAAFTEKEAELEAEKTANAEALAALQAEHEQAISALQAELDAAKAEKDELETFYTGRIEELEAYVNELHEQFNVTVTYNLNDGNGTVITKRVYSGKYLEEPEAPVRPGYTFVGWYIDIEQITFPYSVYYDTVFEAVYEIETYTITYNANDGTMPNGYVTEYTVDSGATLPTPTRSLYYFDGWYETEDFSTEKLTEIPVGETGNKTLYAKWLSATNGIIYQRWMDGGYEFYSVVGYEGTDKEITIPDYVEGLPVAMIGEGAFRGKQKIQSITLPNLLEYIGKEAFKDCISLTTLNICGNRLRYIPESMAAGCTKLESIVIPAVSRVDSYAFEKCTSLKSVIFLGDNVEFGECVFRYCSNLSEVVLPKKLTKLGTSLFNECFSLTTIEIPETVTVIDASAFANCSSLTGVKFGKNLRSIESGAFSNCMSIETAIFPDSLTTIGRSAFSYCSLYYVRLGTGLTSIDEYAFGNTLVICNDSDLLLEFGSPNNGGVAGEAKVIIEQGEVFTRDYYNIMQQHYQYIYTDDGFLFEIFEGNYTLIAYCGFEDTVTLPDDIDGNPYTLRNVKGFVNVIIPDSFTVINDYAFYYSYSLKSVILSPYTESIGKEAFYNCTYLTEVILPEGVQYIGERAFYECKSLTNILLPNSIVEIGGYAFSRTDSLTAVYYYGTAEEWESINRPLYDPDYDNGLGDATVYFYSEAEPTEDGSFWYYDPDGVPTVWVAKDAIIDSLVKIEARPDFAFRNDLTNGSGGEASPIDNDYYLSAYKVTNEQYAAFVSETGHRTPSYWKNGTYPEGKADHPVVDISYSDAVAYCDWLSTKYEDWAFRLPTEAEWENAAMGAYYDDNTVKYPSGSEAPSYDIETGVLNTQFNFNGVIAAMLLKEYGSDYIVTYIKGDFEGTSETLGECISINKNGGVTNWANHGGTATKGYFLQTDLYAEISANGGFTTAVGSFEANSLGLYDMAGNCWDITSSVIVAQNGLEQGVSCYAIRGGSWYATARSCTFYYRGEGRKDSASATVGFRIAAEYLGEATN